MSDHSWKVASSHTTQVDRFKITIDEIVLANQETKNYSYIEFRDGVCVLAMTTKGEIIVLHQYRHAFDTWELEFPAGMIDDEETPLQAAQRELLEETGYQATKWQALGDFYPSPGSTTERIHLFLAKDATKEMEQSLEMTEDIDVRLCDTHEFYHLIENDHFKHGAGLACWAKYLSLPNRRTDS
ncbi:NUDIX hydrolase [Gracilibacillus halophilus YIM-C55.5]|uniref:NUDIX hydrolase n=1 Tax=Gracilibacillus halophilus YIM-C55.5 TaxID=1308866 RepID=N4W5S2_9BACI|nr:NUDIX hydrolase [Gracilibacillus halophilus]ENH95543.1 NUDIX hydrolase [Gracilibacillus halophilus YIM-C55.5]